MWERGGGGGGGTQKTNRAKEQPRKKFLQSEFHCLTYKLYSPEGHLGGPGGPFRKFRNTDIFPFQGWYILCTATSSLALVAKHPYRKTFTNYHGLLGMQ